MIKLLLLSALKLQMGTDDSLIGVIGKTVMNDGYGGIYFWDSMSTLTDDGLTIIQVTGVPTGRWRKIKGLDALTGSYNASGIALTTAYTVTHGLGVVPSIVIITPTSLNAAALSYVSNKTATTFTINFLAVPVVGTNNISFDWLVKA